MNLSSRVIRFSEDDLRLFSRASGDSNPLHLSKSFASRTAYGQRVVFGVLGCVASLGGLNETEGSISRLSADFQRPMSVDVDYRVELSKTRDSAVIRLFDGSMPVLSTTLRFAPSGEVKSVAGDAPTFPLTNPRILHWEQLSEGSSFEGRYRTDPHALRELRERWGLTLDLSVLEALLWSSYFVGMEAPGRDALFFRATFEFSGPVNASSPLNFQAKVVNRNISISQVRSAFRLGSGDTEVASGQLTSFLRPQMPVERLAENEPHSERALTGKTALVVGASRGLGAALTMVLAARGANVIAASRSPVEWRSELQADVAQRIFPWEGDASDESALKDLARIAESRSRGLDFLICCAFPAIPSLRLERGSAERVGAYVTQATNLVLRPMCEFLPLLSQQNGCTVLISSAVVERPVRDWPHYGAAKSATEALCQIAPLQYPRTSSLIVRPERLLTEMTNTPMGRQGAMSPLHLARQICDRLQEPFTAGRHEYFDSAAVRSESAADEQSLEPLQA